jgi:hypothetical protein
MPTKQCVRADEERLLARSPQKSTGRSHKDTIGVPQTWAHTPAIARAQALGGEVAELDCG